MAQTKQTFSFAGGLDTLYSDFLLKDDELRVVLNMHYDNNGALTRRLGYTELGTKPNTDSVKGIFAYYRSDGFKRLMRIAGTKIHGWDGASYSELYTALTTGLRPSAINFLDNWILTNGTDAGLSYDGRDFSTSRNVNNMPKGKFVRVFKFRVYVAGIAGEPNKVKYSSSARGFVADPTADFTLAQQSTGGNLSDGTYYVGYAHRNAFGETKLRTVKTIVLNGGTATQQINITGLPALPTNATHNTIYISTNSGTQYKQGETTGTTFDQTAALVTNTVTQPLVNTTYGISWDTADGASSFDAGGGEEGQVTGMDVVNDRLVVYCEFGTFRWDNYKLVKADTGDGSINHLALARIIRYNFFFNREGVLVYDGVDVKLISKRIQDYILGINQSTITDAAGAAYRRKFYLAVGDIAETGRAIAVTKAVLVYDYDQNNWTIYDNHDVTMWATFITSGKEELYFGTTTGEIMKALTGNSDNGKPITYRAKIGKKFSGSPEEIKNYSRFISFQENGAGASLSVTVQGQQPTVLDSLQEEMEMIDSAGLSGRYYEMEIFGSDSSEPMVWNGYQAEIDNQEIAR